MSHARAIDIGTELEIRWQVVREDVTVDGCARKRTRGARWTWWPCVVTGRRGSRWRVTYDREHARECVDNGGFDSVIEIIDDTTCVDESSDGTKLRWRARVAATADRDGPALARDAEGREAREGDSIEVRWKLEIDERGARCNRWEWWRARVGAQGRTVEYEGGLGFLAETSEVKFTRDGYLVDVRERGDELMWRKSMRDTPIGRVKKPSKVVRVYRPNGTELALGSEQDDRDRKLRRVDNLLASTPRVLGDGHQLSTKWRGSVLDGLMAAILVQNAVDVESVRAFTAIMAAFPATSEMVQEHIRREKIRRIIKSFRILHSAPTDAGVGKSPKEVESENAKARARAFALPEPITSTDDSDLVDWYSVLRADESTLEELLQRRGMKERLSGFIKTILKDIIKERGTLRLQFLHEASMEEIDAVLLKMKGVGPKTASLFKLLTLHREAFPVDVHVARILVRLGWIHLHAESENDDATKSQEQAIARYLERDGGLKHLGVERLFSLHVALIVIGKMFCHSKSKNKLPACEACPLAQQCAFPKNNSAADAQSPKKLTAAPPIATSSLEDSIRTKVRGGGVTSTTANAAAADFDIGTILNNFNKWKCAGALIGPSLLQVLQLDANADEAAVNDRFAYLSRALHPDKKGGDERKTMAFVAVKAARDAFKASRRSPSPLISMDLEGSTTIGLELDLAPNAAPSAARDEIRCYVISQSTACFLPEKLCDVLGGRARTYGCLLVPLPSVDDDSTPWQQRLVICVPHRAALKEAFPLHATFFVTNEVFLDSASVDVPVVIRSQDLEHFFSDVSRIFFGTSLHATCKSASKHQLMSTFDGRSCCFQAWNRDTGMLSPLPERFLPPAAPSRNMRSALASPTARPHRNHLAIQIDSM